MKQKNNQVGQIKYYKPLSLVVGLLLFGISCISGGLIFTLRPEINVYWIIGWLLGTFIGELFILNAASYKVK